MLDLPEWFKKNNILEVEAIIPDLTGVARGKILPADKYSQDKSLRLPESIFIQAVNGDYPDQDNVISAAEIDIVLRPDLNTVTLVPWANEPTAQIIHDAFYGDGRYVDLSPRYVLRRILKLYHERGWQPIVAPELEFYLVKPNLDADYPLEAPIGRTGRAESGPQSYSIDGVNDFEPLFEDVYVWSEAQKLGIDTLIHETGTAQFEINLLHGDALELADQAFRFKRTLREAALKHKMYATFMAKPMAGQPGSAMHIHQSIIDKHTGENIFSHADGTPASLFFYHLGGLQKYLPHVMALLAPNVNSYRRFTRNYAAPVNVEWGYDNRTTGLRIPMAEPQARRIENRLAGADANPYLVLAASLACGYLGMIEEIEPRAPIERSGYDGVFSIPRSLNETLRALENCPELIEVFGERFVRAYVAVKDAENEAFSHVISSWEREFLLLSV